MDKILSSILCCSFGSKPEHKSSTSSTSSSRNTAESNKRADLKKLDQNDDIDEVGNVSIDKMKSNNAQTIILQPVANNIDQKDSQTKTSSSYTPTPVTPVTPNSNSNSNSNSNFNTNPNNANGNVDANQRQQNEATYAHDSDVRTNEAYQSHATVHNDANITPNGDANNGDQDVNNVQPSSSNVSEYDGQEFIDESQFDLTAMQPDQVVASTGWLLEAPDKKYKNKKCLVLDLDETLVHSSFKYLRSADFVIPVEIEGQIHNVYVIKRPGVDEFMKRVGELYEVVVFTASVSRYGDPLLDELDIHKSVHHRLFRDSCYNYQGNYIKNLSQIGRPLRDLIIIDNSPASYIFHPQHAVPISSWFSDAHDNELLDILPFLEDLAKQDVDDVSLVLDVTT